MSIVERVWTLLEAVAGGTGDEAFGIVRVALGACTPADKMAAAALKNNASGDAARALFAKALGEAVADMRAACGMDGPIPTPSQWGAIELLPEGAVLRWDAALAGWIASNQGLGEPASPSAQGLLKKASARLVAGRDDVDNLWSGWLKPGEGLQPASSPALITIARLLWLSQVRPELERVQEARRRHPGVPLAVVDRIRPTLASGGTLKAGAGETHTLVGPTGEPAGTVLLSSPGVTPVVDAAALEVLGRGVPSLGRLITHRALRWIVVTAHERDKRGEEKPHIIEVRGWGELVELCEGTSKKDQAHLRDALLLLDRLRFDLPDGSTSGLLAIRHWRALKTRGRAYRVQITVLSPLMPHSAAKYPQGQRRIVPLTDLPPFVGRAQDHGSQAALQLAVLGEMTRQSVQIPASGGVRLTDTTWRDLSRRTGLPESTLPRVQERWLHDGADGPAFLRLVAKERYALAPAHHAAWDYMSDGGQRVAKGKAAGLRSAAARRKKWGSE